MQIRCSHYPCSMLLKRWTYLSISEEHKHLLVEKNSREGETSVGDSLNILSIMNQPTREMWRWETGRAEPSGLLAKREDRKTKADVQRGDLWFLPLACSRVYFSILFSGGFLRETLFQKLPMIMEFFSPNFLRNIHTYFPPSLPISPKIDLNFSCFSYYRLRTSPTLLVRETIFVMLSK